LSIEPENSRPSEGGPAGPPFESVLPAERSWKPAQVLIAVLTGVATMGVMRLVPVQARLQLYIGAGVGLGLALLPYFVARKRGHQKFALGALGGGLIAGAVGGAILALPLAVVLTVIASRRKAVLEDKI
jgi:hypothetical protein